MIPPRPKNLKFAGGKVDVMARPDTESQSRSNADSTSSIPCGIPLAGTLAAPYGVATLPPPTIPPRFDSGKIYEAKVLYDDTNVLPGSRQRAVGEIIRQAGKIYVVTKVTQSGAVCDACGSKRVSIRDRFSDKVSEFSSPDRGSIRISSQCDAAEPIEKMSDEDFASRKSGAGDSNKTGIERNNSMKKTHVKNPKNKTGVNYVGRATRVEKLVALGKTDKEILAIIAGEFHGSSPKLVLGCIAAKRLKAKKAASAATKPSSKKTPAKPAKKSTKPARAASKPEPAATEPTAASESVSIPPRPTPQA
jgi:hypothetical protein